MIKIGNVEVNEFFECEEEQIEKEYLDILEKIKDNPNYFHGKSLGNNSSWIDIKETLKYRRNSIDWLPIDKGASVLEIMSGCGVLTELLAKKAQKVTCLEKSKTKSLINAYRNQSSDNVEICMSDYATFCENNHEKYDYIIWIEGVMEHKEIAPDFNTFEELLNDIKRLLKSNGTIVCAVKNPLGLRYLAGYPDEITGQFFKGLTGDFKEGAQTGYTRDVFLEMFQNASYKNINCYYPYPDHMFPMVIYSDDRLPQKGELLINMCNFQKERVVLFDETSVYDTIIGKNMFEKYSNSYLVMAQKE